MWFLVSISLYLLSIYYSLYKEKYLDARDVNTFVGVEFHNSELYIIISFIIFKIMEGKLKLGNG